MRRAAALLLAVAALVGACGGDDDEDDAASTTTTEAPADGSTTSSSAGETSTTSTTAAPTGEEDPAEAAEAFLATFFPESTATLSAFREGDSRSGEFEVLRPSEGGGTANVAATLLMRLDDNDRWQVLGAVSPNVTIEAPASGAQVASGPLAVSGVGRGFEATLVVRALDLDGEVVAEAVGTGGAFADPEPYEVELDLAAVPLNTPLVVVVSGGTGLEGDPGEFSAVRVITA